MLSVFTDTPGVTAPIQANILPPTFQASCPPPHGSDTLAPGKLPQMALTMSRLIASPSWLPPHCVSEPRQSLSGPAHGRNEHRIFLPSPRRHQGLLPASPATSAGPKRSAPLA